MSGEMHSDRSSFFTLLNPVLFRVDFFYISQYRGKQVSSPQAAACVRGEAYEPYYLMIR
jgi:hypothetical protein